MHSSADHIRLHRHRMLSEARNGCLGQLKYQIAWASCSCRPSHTDINHNRDFSAMMSPSFFDPRGLARELLSRNNHRMLWGLLPLRRIVPHVPRPSKKTSTGEAPHLLTLPAGFRCLTYEHCFASARIAPKAHPRDRHCTAILLVSKQCYNEALPIPYECAALALDLDPKHHKGIPPFANFLESRPLISGSCFKGDVAQLDRFNHFHLTAASSPSFPCFSNCA